MSKKTANLKPVSNPFKTLRSMRSFTTKESTPKKTSTSSNLTPFDKSKARSIKPPKYGIQAADNPQPLQAKFGSSFAKAGSLRRKGEEGLLTHYGPGDGEDKPDPIKALILMLFAVIRYKKYIKKSKHHISQILNKKPPSDEEIIAKANEKSKNFKLSDKKGLLSPEDFKEHLQEFVSSVLRYNQSGKNPKKNDQTLWTLLRQLENKRWPGYDGRKKNKDLNLLKRLLVRHAYDAIEKEEIKMELLNLALAIEHYQNRGPNLIYPDIDPNTIRYPRRHSEGAALPHDIEDYDSTQKLISGVFITMNYALLNALRAKARVTARSTLRGFSTSFESFYPTSKGYTLRTKSPGNLINKNNNDYRRNVKFSLKIANKTVQLSAMVVFYHATSKNSNQDALNTIAYVGHINPSMELVGGTNLGVLYSEFRKKGELPRVLYFYSLNKRRIGYLKMNHKDAEIYATALERWYEEIVLDEILLLAEEQAYKSTDEITKEQLRRMYLHLAKQYKKRKIDPHGTRQKDFSPMLDKVSKNIPELDD